MINIERVLQWNIALIVVVGALLLSLGNGQYFLPILAGGSALFSLIFVDKLGWFVLNRFAANILALIVAVIPLLNFFDNDNQAQLVSIARLLIHLQIVLLLEKKTSRIYWQLFILSVLQVVVAAALRLDLHGGLLFAVYILLDFSGMILMLMQRDRERVLQANVLSAHAQKDAQAMLLGNSPARILRAAPLASFKRTHSARQYLAFYLKQALIFTLMAIAFATFLFYSVQRTGDTWQGGQVQDFSMVGFTDSIRLGEEGVISESSRPVMRVRLFEYGSDQPFEMEGPLFLRGTTLHSYTRENGVMGWKPTRRRLTMSLVRSRELNNIDDRTDYVKQEISLEPTKRPFLFTQFPALAINLRDRNRFEFDPYRNSLQLEEEPKTRDELRYDLAVMNIRERMQSKSYPYENPFSSRQEPMLSQQESELLGLPSERTSRGTLQYIRTLAEEWAAATNDPDDRRLVSLGLERRFQEDTRFRYTLDFRDVKRDLTLDPVVDFLKNHRQGHCEYFSSALVMMLRSLGIPARLVVGYYGPEYNDIGKFYQVEMRHAHVWVEAYMRPQDITQEMIDKGDASPSGAWLRLNPMPLNSEISQINDNNPSVATRANDALGFAQMLWDDFVVGLNAERQQKALFQGSMDKILEGTYWQTAFNATASKIPLVKNDPQLAVQVVLFVLAIAMVGYYFSPRRQKKTSTRRNRSTPRTWLQRISPRLARLFGQTEVSEETIAIEFYRRVENLLQQSGYQREKPQTTREFFASVSQALGNHPEKPEINRCLNVIANRFYAARFSDHELSDREKSDVISAIAGLENLLTIVPPTR